MTLAGDQMDSVVLVLASRLTAVVPDACQIERRITVNAGIT